jgi:hypothetical protein
MQVFSCILAISSLLLVSACETVHVRSPIGSEPHSVDADDWNGTWILGNGDTCKLQVLDEEGGVLEMGFIEEKSDRLEPTVLKIWLREHGEWTFASFEDPNHPGLHAWLRVWREEQQLILWIPDADRFASRVRDGDLPGTVDLEGDVVLDALDSGRLDAITTDLALGLFYWDQPLAMIRIGTPD